MLSSAVSPFLLPGHNRCWVIWILLGRLPTSCLWSQHVQSLQQHITVSIFFSHTSLPPVLTVSNPHLQWTFYSKSDILRICSPDLTVSCLLLTCKPLIERESLFTDYQPIWASHQREGTQQVSYTIVSNTVILLPWQRWVWTCAIPLFSSLQYYCDPGWPSAEMHTCFHLNYSVLVLSVQTVFFRTKWDSAVHSSVAYIIMPRTNLPL